MNDVVINGIAINGFLILLISAMCSGSSVLICCDSSNITKRVNSSAPMVEGVITGLVEFFEISFVSTAAENRHFAFFFVVAGMDLLIRLPSVHRMVYRYIL